MVSVFNFDFFFIMAERFLDRMSKQNVISPFRPLSFVEFPSLPPTSLSGQSYTTVQNYTAEDEDELSIPKGVRVEVTEKSLTGWWRVK